MSSDLIKAQHAFTTRYGGVSKGELASLNLGSNRGDEPEAVRENYRRVCELMGVGIDDCAVTKQVHGNVVRIVDEKDKHACMSNVPYEADGIVTNVKNMPIMCFVADCVPVLLCDEKNSVAAAVHCGWRSSVTDILKEAVEKMCQLGAEKENICVAMGASIGPCCFETDADVPQALLEAFGNEVSPFITQSGSKYYVNLKEINALILGRAGVRHIEISSECTKCRPDRFWSHRITGNIRGSQGAIIVCKEETP